jgi:hypothetical protein
MRPRAATARTEPHTRPAREDRVSYSSLILTFLNQIA